jgi:hypothetical protein
VSSVLNEIVSQGDCSTDSQNRRREEEVWRQQRARSEAVPEVHKCGEVKAMYVMPWNEMTNCRTVDIMA